MFKTALTADDAADNRAVMKPSATTGTTSPSRRRKRRSGQSRDIGSLLKDRRTIDRAMFGLSAAWLLAALYGVYSGSRYIGALALWDSPAQLVYAGNALGGLTARGGGVFTADAPGGGRYTARLGAEGVETLECGGPVGSVGCDAVLGIAPGSAEVLMLQRLGHPDRVRFDGRRKLATYDGLGATFELEAFTVRSVRLTTRRAGFIGQIARAARVILP